MNEQMMLSSLPEAGDTMYLKIAPPRMTMLCPMFSAQSLICRFVLSSSLLSALLLMALRYSCLAGTTIQVSAQRTSRIPRELEVTRTGHTSQVHIRRHYGYSDSPEYEVGRRVVCRIKVIQPSRVKLESSSLIYSRLLPAEISMKG